MGNAAARHARGGFCAAAGASRARRHDPRRRTDDIFLARTAPRRAHHFAAPSDGLVAPRRGLAIRRLRDAAALGVELLHYNAGHAAGLLERVAGLSPAALEEPISALAHGNFLRFRSRARGRLALFLASVARTPPPPRIPRLGGGVPSWHLVGNQSRGGF